VFFFFSSRRRHTRSDRDWSSDVCSSDLVVRADEKLRAGANALLLAAAVDVLASATEAHEARHALDDANPDGPPPPPALFEVMGRSEERRVGKECRSGWGREQ